MFTTILREKAGRSSLSAPILSLFLQLIVPLRNDYKVYLRAKAEGATQIQEKRTDINSILITSDYIT